MRFVLIEGLICLAIATLFTFVYGVPGSLFATAYVGTRGTLCRSISARFSGYSLIGIAALLYSVYSGLPIAPDAARRMSSSNDVAVARKAVQDYVTDQGILPWLDDRHPHLSWRVKVLPYIGMQPLYDNLDLSQPWNSEANLRLLVDIKNPFPQTVFGSEVFCIRASLPPKPGIPSILFVEMRATPTHWAALEKDPTPDEFLDHYISSIHTTETVYSTFYRRPSGSFAVLSDWQLIFVDSRLSQQQWQKLVDPSQRFNSAIDTLLSGDQFTEHAVRYDKVIGLGALLILILLHFTHSVDLSLADESLVY